MKYNIEIQESKMKDYIKFVSRAFLFISLFVCVVACVACAMQGLNQNGEPQKWGQIIVSTIGCVFSLSNMFYLRGSRKPLGL